MIIVERNNSILSFVLFYFLCTPFWVHANGLIFPMEAPDDQQEEMFTMPGDFTSKYRRLNSYFAGNELLDATLRNYSKSTYIDIPEYKRPSQLVLEKLGGGNYLGVNPQTSKPCLLTDNEKALDQFLSFSPCWMNNLYEENFDENIAKSYEKEVFDLHAGEPPQAFSLRLKEKGVEEFCQCTKKKKRIFNQKSQDNGKTEASERKKEILDNLARDGMSRIHNKFQKIQKRVAYSITSREMSGFTTRQLEKSDNKSQAESRTTLNYCMPSEMTKLLSATSSGEGGTGQRLCGERGIRRLAEGMRDGTKLGCQQPSTDPQCSDSAMDSINLEDGADPLDEIMRGLQEKTGKGSEGGAEIENLNQVLRRHEETAKVPYKSLIYSRGGSRYLDQPGAPMGFIPIGEPDFTNSNLNSGKYSDSIMDMVNRSRRNEFSDKGKVLWNRSMRSIKKVFDTAINNFGVASDDSIDKIDTNHLKNYLETNPYLLRRLLKGIRSKEPKDLLSDANLRLAVKHYVEDDLYRAYKKEGFRKDYELSALMGITYGPEYYETLNECEEIQKTMISLCQALDQDESSESMGAFFTDARVLNLYADGLRDMQKGEASPDAYENFGAAAYYFCEEVEDKGVNNLNQKQQELEVELAKNQYFAQMENERKTIHLLAGNDYGSGGKVTQTVGEYLERNALAENNQNVSVVRVEKMKEESRQDSDKVFKRVKIKKNRNVINNTSNSIELDNLIENPQIANGGTRKGSVDISKESVSKKEGQKEIDPSKSADSQNTSQYNRFQESFNTDQSPNSGFSVGQNVETLNREEGLSQTNISNEKLKELSPVEQSLMDQLESMREREALMSKQLEELNNKIEEEGEKEELDEKEEEVANLKQQMRSLKKELAEEKAQRVEKERAESSRARIGPSESGTPSIFGSARPENLSPSDKQAPPAFRRTPKSISSAPVGGAPKREVSESAKRSEIPADTTKGQASRSSGSSTPSLTGTVSQPIARIRIPKGVTINPQNTSLSDLARDADGNIAFIETLKPGVFKRYVFKTSENGEIVYNENGDPVVDKEETVTVEESEQLAVSEEEKSTEEASRSPASSLEDVLLEIDKKVNPRKTHQDLKDTLKQNISN